MPATAYLALTIPNLLENRNLRVDVCTQIYKNSYILLGVTYRRIFKLLAVKDFQCFYMYVMDKLLSAIE